MKNVLFLLFYTVMVFGQEIELATDVVDDYSIDRFANEIYFEQYYYPGNGAILKRIMKTNFSGDYFIETDLEVIPIFANLMQKYTFREFIGPVNNWNYFETSNDNTNKNFLFNNKSGIPIYSLKDNYLYINFYGYAGSGVFNYNQDSLVIFEANNLKYFSFETIPQWISDSTLLAYSHTYNNSGSEKLYSSVNRLNVNSAKVDTLLKEYSNNGSEITAYSYDKRNELLAINLLSQGFTNNTLKIYSFINQEMELFIVKDSIRWGGSLYGIKEMKWSPNGNYLAIMADPYILSGGGLYIFSLTGSSLYEVFNPDNHYGVLGYVKWLDSNKLTYINRTYKTLNIYNVSSIVSVQEENRIDPLNTIKISNFPNPFNNSTNIDYTITKNGEVSIEIYSVLGDLVFKKNIGFKSAGSYMERWNGINSSTGSMCASGIYIIKINQLQKNIKHSSISKTVLMK